MDDDNGTNMHTVTAPHGARVGVIGDYDPTVTAHRGITTSMQMLEGDGWPLSVTWIAPRDVEDVGALTSFSGFWCAPGSPYSSTGGALQVIQYAREHEIPFLGTCGGFQHALLEYARNVLSIPGAEHEELAPQAESLVVSALSCSMVEVQGDVILSPSSKIAALTGMLRIREGYHCNFGLNPKYAEAFARSGFRTVAHGEDGEPRAGELAGHPFFVGTLFQPERAVLTGRGVHALILGFAAAVVGHANGIRVF